METHLSKCPGVANKPSLTCSGQTKIPRKFLTLVSMLTLALGIGCDEQQTQSKLQHMATAPSGMDRLTAPMTGAPLDVRIRGEYIVVFADEVARTAVESAAGRVAQSGGDNRVLHRYSVISGFAARLDDAALDELRGNPSVAYIEENQHIRINSTYPSPADGIDRTDQRLGHNGIYDDQGRTGAGVHVYVLDTGINTQHTEFTGRIGGGYTAITDGMGIQDCHGHGSHVSSTAAGKVYGMAKQATLHPVRVLDCTGGGTLAGVIAGVDFVRSDCPKQNGPCVANMSLGGASMPALNQAVANAVASRVTFVVAAGNENVDACSRSPAAEPKAITVAALDDVDQRAWFSNWGSCVDIFAPGVTVLGAWIGSSTAVRTLDGTSMASPHVAGAVAQYLSSNPQATPAQVEVNLKGSASLDCVGDPRGSPNTVLFNDFNQGNYHCTHQPPASCQGLCGGQGDGCFCDPECEIYKDCCADHAQVCK